MNTPTTSSNFHYLFKYIIIGNAAVGKSNILLKYIHNTFKPEYQLTIGVEFGAKNVTMKDKIVRIQIWDTAGQENYRSITRAYYKNCVCALVVYDISNSKSFQDIQTWVLDCRNNSPKTTMMVLVGNKKDLESQRQVSYDEGLTLASKNGMMFYESSAKTGESIDEIFYESAKEICRKIDINYYNLENELCGIKCGKAQNDQMINLAQSTNDEIRIKKGCCY